MSDDLNNVLGLDNSGAAAPAAPQGDLRWGRAHKLSQRYVEGYKASDLLVSLGGVIKIIGYVIGGIAVLIGIIGFIVAASSYNPGSGLGIALVAILYGAIIVFFMFVYGALIAAIGHLNRSAQDSAVNNSPFLTDDERASILSLD